MVPSHDAFPGPLEGHAAPPGRADDFIFVKIPVARNDDADPLHRREDAIDQMLRAQGLGLVIGWGDSLGERRSDGRRTAAYIRIDIRVNDLHAARSALRMLLPTLGAPAGTEVHYTLHGRSLLDMASDNSWQLEQPLKTIKNQPNR